MSVPIDREFIVQAFIVLSLCVGGWMFLVEPAAKELSELDAVIAEQRRLAASMDHSTLEDIAKNAPVIRQRAREIYAAGHFSKDSSALYGLISSLAKEHEVKVKNLRPGVEHQMGTKDNPFIVTRIDMTVDGDYERIARFLESLDGIGAYLRPVSVQIAPSKSQEGSHTVMQLGFEAMRFNLADSLMAFVEKKQ